MNVLFIGDIVGRAGRRAVRNFLPDLIDELSLDLVLANGENSAGGFGITAKVADELYAYGIDCLTMGNHTWDNNDIFNFIDQEKNLIRPLNYVAGTPGRGWTLIELNNVKVGVINLIGQVYMAGHNVPYQVYKNHLPEISAKADIIIIDFHAEATGEKMAFANAVDGEVAAVVGTHTHVQTADERILPGGTAYITDLGLTGAIDSILGMDKEKIVERHISQLPNRYEVATGEVKLEGLFLNINENTGSIDNLQRINKTN